MKKLLSLEFRRLKKNNTLILLVTLMVAIGIFGYILNIIFYPDSDNAKVGILSMYNAYTQFLFLILAYIFSNIFAGDFSRGITLFYRQMGVSLKKLIACKAMLVMALIIPAVDLIFVIVNILYKNSDWGYLLLVIACVDLGIIFTVVLSILVAVIAKKVMTATIVMYGLFLVFDVINTVSFGITNPADSNSLTTLVLSKFADSNFSNIYSEKMTIDFQTQGVFLALTIPIIWIILLAVSSFIIIRKK